MQDVRPQSRGHERRAHPTWVIDFGPEGGEAGGQLVGQGTPEEIAATGGDLPTAAALRRWLAR